jgi:hypothetical protein
MIKIELQFETGAEAREALEQLLGFKSIEVAQRLSISDIKDEKNTKNFEASKTEVVKDERSAEEVPIKKRRTKAEVEAEKSAQNEPEPSIEQANEGESETKQLKAPAVTKEMLQEKAVNLIRNSQKDAVVAVLKKFGADSIAQADKNPLKVEDYSAAMDELNKL